MNTIIKNTLTFTIGFIAGGFVTLVYLRNIHNEQMFELMDRCETELNASREVLENACEALEPATMGVGWDEEAPSIEKMLVQSKNRYKKIARNYNHLQELTEEDPADDVYAAPEEDEEEVIREYEDLSKKGDPDGYSEIPHVISLEEFSEGASHFFKETLYFYEDDDVLTDESEEVAVDIVSLLGEDALDSFGQESEDPEVVYVRNAKLRTDYEVIRLSKSYSETVLGIMDDPGHKPPVRRRDSDEE